MNKLYKDQRGIAHVLLGVLVVLVIGVAAGTGYMVYRSQTGANVSVDKTVKDKCMTEVNDKKFCIFSGHLSKIGDYKFAATGTSGGLNSSFTVAYAGNNSQMIVTLTGQPTAEVVTYNGVTYLKDPSDNQWIQYGANAANKPTMYNLKTEILKSDFKNDAGQKLQYSYVGKVSCGSLKCYKYQIIDPAKASAKSYIMFDTKDFALRELESNDGTDTLKATMTYENVNISKPSPVKTTIE